MKKLVLISIILLTISACGENKVKKTASKPQPAVEDIKKNKSNESPEIEKAGRSFYDWYFKHHFQYINVLKDKNEKCLLDTTSYFRNLRKLKTVSEKFIAHEKSRLQGCASFIATIPYSEYENADAYTYDEYCLDLYYMYWIGSQEEPNSFSVKNLKLVSDDKATLDIYLNYGGQDEALSEVKLEKENGLWKIVKIDFFKKEQKEQKEKVKETFQGKWQNAMVTLSIGETSLAFEYHGQCVYFYPVRKISDTEFEMIWAREMDCKFDNGTGNSFGLLKGVPEIGKPFAKFSLKDNILKADFYYKTWVRNYTEQVQKDVFTEMYFRKNENN
ncbi:hypothetical protein [Pedobacter caeni]|uniref:DUF3828 domain-containing protein n=1 Tax=Pedobacter caeni TaxID=288992 RepID=A0A1M4TXP6_9SPHI|nr:hypothetical protein [Pedobacter caeni]SHE49198.1 hypothetical protein SAMN04488522_101357 [Pedobacter caeni]